MNEKPFSAVEYEILLALQQGKSDGEIAAALHLTKRTLGHHLKRIRGKLHVHSRSHAVDRALALGLLKPISTESGGDRLPKLKVGLVGCGSGGAAVLEMFTDNPAIEVVFVSDIDPGAAGVALARKLGVAIYENYAGCSSEEVDLIIDLTGSTDASEEIMRLKSPDTELMGGLSAMLMWQMTAERRERLAQRDRTLRAHESLYHLGRVIENIDSLKDAAYAIIDYAAKLLDMPAGSLAVIAENGEEMQLVTAKGLSDRFIEQRRWPIRKGGLTDNLLSQNAPICIPDLNGMPNKNPLLLQEGLRSLVASPLMVQKRIVGVLYLNDFVKRELGAEEMSLFSLISIYAALTVDRVMSIERLWDQSQRDGLTGIFNHRYLMEQTHKELQRAARHQGQFSIIMIDVDNFKAYNDSYGHLEGNKVLKEVAKILVEAARVSDTVGRFGGEEFFIVAPELNKAQTLAFAERVVKNVAAHGFPNRQVTISAGIATYPEDGDNMMDLIKAADVHLYRAKARGKNRVCSAC